MPINIRFQNWFHYLFIHHTQRINERHCMKYCQMMGQINIIFLMHMFSNHFQKTLETKFTHYYMLLFYYFMHRKFRQAFIFTAECRVGHHYFHTNIVVVLFILKSFILFRCITSRDYSVLLYVCLYIIGA